MVSQELLVSRISSITCSAVWGLSEILHVHLIRRPLRPAQVAVGIGIVDEALFLRIPMQMQAGLHGNVMNQAGGAGAVAHLRRSDRLLA